VAQSCRRGSPSASPRCWDSPNNLDPAGTAPLDDRSTPEPRPCVAFPEEGGLRQTSSPSHLALSLLESECPQEAALTAVQLNGTQRENWEFTVNKTPSSRHVELSKLFVAGCWRLAKAKCFSRNSRPWLAPHAAAEA